MSACTSLKSPIAIHRPADPASEFEAGRYPAVGNDHFGRRVRCGLVACFNPLLEDRRRRKWESLLAATEKQFARIAAEVARRQKKPLTKAEIGVKTGKVLNKYKVGKHFTLTIEDGRFSWQRKQTEHRAHRDPVAQAEPAVEVCRKKAIRRSEEGYPLNSFRTLLATRNAAPHVSLVAATRPSRSARSPTQAHCNTKPSASSNRNCSQ